jgi:hypothetical protein
VLGARSLALLILDAHSCCAIVLGGAAPFEILQTLTPDRHGTMGDALEKMLAALPEYL